MLERLFANVVLVIVVVATLLRTPRRRRARRRCCRCRHWKSHGRCGPARRVALLGAFWVGHLVVLPSTARGGTTGRKVSKMLGHGEGIKAFVLDAAKDHPLRRWRVVGFIVVIIIVRWWRWGHEELFARVRVLPFSIDKLDLPQRIK